MTDIEARITELEDRQRRFERRIEDTLGNIGTDNMDADMMRRLQRVDIIKNSVKVLTRTSAGKTLTFDDFLTRLDALLRSIALGKVPKYSDSDLVVADFHAYTGGVVG